jgi:uncharacterized protein YggE
MGEGQGLRVGDVISVVEGERLDPFGSIEGGGGYRYKTSANLRAMPIESGAVEVAATVTVVFALKSR